MCRDRWLVLLVLFAACPSNGAPKRPDAGDVRGELIERLDVPAEVAHGISGLAASSDGTLYAVPERARRLLMLDGRAGLAVKSATIAIDGVPEGTDLESIAWIAPGQFVAGTETDDEARRFDLVYAGELRAGCLALRPALAFPYALFGLRGEPNRGIEGLCAAGGWIVAASEVVGATKSGQRFAPIAVHEAPRTFEGSAEVARDDGRWSPHRLLLTTEKGKISALSCRTVEANGRTTLDVLAIERHYEVTRILHFELPLPAPGGPGALGAEPATTAEPDASTKPVHEVTPEVWLDLAPLFGDAPPNFEGLARVSDDDLVLVSDNDYGRVTGPTIVVRIRRR